MQPAGMSNPDYAANIVGQQSSAATPDNSNDPRIADIMNQVIQMQEALKHSLEKMRAYEERMEILEYQMEFLLTNTFELLSEQVSESINLKRRIDPSEQSEVMDLHLLFAQASLSRDSESFESFENLESSESILTVETPSKLKGGNPKKKIRVENKEESLLLPEAFFNLGSFAEGTKDQTGYQLPKLVKQPRDGITAPFKRSRLNSDVSPDQVSETVPSSFEDNYR